jgi:MFS transporter, putative metabolite:H+ symporter
MIRFWVPESPRWLMRMGRKEEARRSLAWALQVDPREIELSAVEGEKTRWRELFKYPRNVVAVCLTGLSQTGGVGLLLWITTLFVLVLKITPAEASFLVIWLGVAAIAGRFLCAWMSDAMGRRASIAVACVLAAVATSLAGLLNSVYLGTLSLFYLMILLQQVFGNGSYAIIGPYMAEVWPSRLRASGMGIGYGVGNLGKFIGPAGLAVIAGSSNLVSPKATLDALILGMNYFAFWYVVAALVVWLIGFETRGRTIAEIDSDLTASARVKARVA